MTVTYTGHTQKNGAVLIVFTIKTAPFFCVYPVLIFHLEIRDTSVLEVVADNNDTSSFYAIVDIYESIYMFIKWNVLESLEKMRKAVFSLPLHNM